MKKIISIILISFCLTGCASTSSKSIDLDTTHIPETKITKAITKLSENKVENELLSILYLNLDYITKIYNNSDKFVNQYLKSNSESKQKNLKLLTEFMNNKGYKLPDPITNPQNLDTIDQAIVLLKEQENSLFNQLEHINNLSLDSETKKLIETILKDTKENKNKLNLILVTI